MATTLRSFQELAQQAEGLDLQSNIENEDVYPMENRTPENEVARFSGRDTKNPVGGKAMTQNGKAALLVDVANSEELDLSTVLEQAYRFGHLQEMKAYGDFRQHHLTDLAGTLYGLGFEIVHCPSWPNGGTHPDGSRKWKRTDDVLMQRGALELLIKRPSIKTFIFATADADIIPTCHTLHERGKRVVLIYKEGCLGLVFRKCPFELISMAQEEVTTRIPTVPASANGNGPNELTH